MQPRLLLSLLTLSILAPFVAPTASSAQPKKCSAVMETPAKHRLWRRVGVVYINTSPDEIKKKLYVPLPNEGGRVKNLNQMGFEEFLPKHFWTSDGVMNTAFIEVDMRPGSNLQRSILLYSARVAQLQRRNGDFIEVLRTFWKEKFQAVPPGWRGGLPDDYIIPSHPRQWAEVENLPAGHEPVDTGLIQPNVPFEYFLAKREGVCFHKSLLTALILQQLGIPHRLVSGEAVNSADGTRTGHTWIELPDGRILDPEWQTVGYPTSEFAPEGWFWFAGRKLYRSQTYPIAIDPP